MIITSKPIEYACERLAFWSVRLRTAQERPCERAAGGFQSKSAKTVEIAACRGAIQALNEIIEAEYVENKQ